MMSVSLRIPRAKRRNINDELLTAEGGKIKNAKAIFNVFLPCFRYGGWRMPDYRGLPNDKFKTN